MTLHSFSIVRLIFFALIILCSVGVLALEFSIDSLLDDFSADISRLSGNVNVYGGHYPWYVGHWAIGASAVTLASFILLFILDLIRPWSLVVVEIITMAILRVIWIISSYKATVEFRATHCEQASIASLFIPTFAPVCHRYTAFLALSWIVFSLTIIYTIVLVVLGIRATRQGHKHAWFKSASSLPFFPDHTYDDKVNRV